MRIQVFPDDLIILKLIPWSILRQISASRFNKLIMARLLEVIFRVHCSYGHDINSFLDSKKDVFCPRFFFSTYVIVTTPFVVQSKKSSGTIQARLWTATTTNNLVIVLGPWFSPGNFDKKLQNWIKSANLPQLFLMRPRSILDMVSTWEFSCISGEHHVQNQSGSQGQQLC